MAKKAKKAGTKKKAAKKKKASQRKKKPGVGLVEGGRAGY
jgi:hypothetical protein